ncbi:MAG: hypothetical protein KGL18_07500 [Burkholderiales bacterium]|nr:hypothetical protein [Burkholderiales bacterium]MDE1926069.1 hypothetical protein [Burkholderiales bacterium]MDE2158394.1 hypothetical protein [Burkholderiales bacterium]MDE2502804.1 hypothetical protein [Burkholderiales bacterium]
MDDPVVIVGLGARTPLGEGAWASAAAVRAGISAFERHRYMIDTAGEPMRVACVAAIEIEVQGVDRYEALLFPAIAEALELFAGQGDAGLRLALALALPPPRPGLPSELQRELIERIQRRWPGLFDAAAVFANGHAAGLMALQAGRSQIRQGRLDACLVAGVDSYLEPETLEWLESCDQLHGAGSLNNAWGFIPGEAAGALLLSRATRARERGWQPLAAVLGCGVAHEPKRIKTETVCIGEGLTEAFRGALAALPHGRKVSDIYCDMNGEPYRADEFGFSVLRTKEYFESAGEFAAPADGWGDVGAAGGVLHLALATAAGQKGYARGPLAFAWASAEGGERATALLAVAQAQGQEA